MIFFGYDVMKYMESGSKTLKNPSSDWVWHHTVEKQGIVQLIPQNQHQDSAFQIVLHPGPNGQGGYGLYK